MQVLGYLDIVVVCSTVGCGGVRVLVVMVMVMVVMFQLA